MGMPNFSQNYSRQDMGVAEAVLNFVTNFCKTGDPNEAGHQQVEKPYPIILFHTLPCIHQIPIYFLLLILLNLAESVLFQNSCVWLRVGVCACM